MRHIPVEKIATYGTIVLSVVLLSPLVHKVPRSGGTNVVFHVLYCLVFGLAIAFIPDWIQNECFSPGGTVVLMNIIPLYDSIASLCSPNQRHNSVYLQYWISAHLFTLATEFMDDITNTLPSAGEHWYEFEFFLIGWLACPLTDGAALLSKYITRPFLRPITTKLKAQLEGYIMQVFLIGVNTSYLWFLWLFFLTLPEEARRFLTIALGTVYPMIASTAVVASGDDDIGANDMENDNEEERFWLAYWASYSLLFLAMDYLENFVGSIRGFYSACAVATLYLFLPMFKGADVILRRILVPLTRQQENFIVRDAYSLKRSVMKQHRRDPQAQARVFSRIAEVFQEAAKSSSSGPIDTKAKKS
jgi:TB2/DP1, HVA22 family